MHINTHRYVFINMQVNVNGQEFYLYQHRMPLERVCALEIGGNVVVDSINIIGVRTNCVCLLIDLSL